MAWTVPAGGGPVEAGARLHAPDRFGGWTPSHYRVVMAHPGPTELGRGVVVLPGSEVPEPWSACPRVTVGAVEVDDPGPTVEVLHGLWLERRPMVVELAVDPGVLRAPQRYDGPVHALDPGFEFTLERLHFLVWANTYDARQGDPVWWHGRRAARLGADGGVREGGPADITLADGTPMYVDGGPAGPCPIPSDAAAAAGVGVGVGVVHRWNVEAGSPARHR